MRVRIAIELELISEDVEQLVVDTEQWFRNRAWEFTEHEGEDVLKIDVELVG